MDLGMDGKVVLVTGGTDGLGLATARRLASEGARAVIIGRDESRLAAAAASISDAGGQVLAIPADVTRRGDLERVISEIDGRWGRLDGLVNAAGVHTSGAFEETTDEEWQDDFELKLLAAIRGIRLALPLLRQNQGAVLNVLSIWARYQDAGSMPSSVFRAAGLALTKGVSKEVAKDGVRVNAILVGFVRSGQSVRTAQNNGLTPDEYDQGLVDSYRIPAGRVGHTDEFADVASFLLSSRASYLNGTAVNIDGGLSPVT